MDKKKVLRIAAIVAAVLIAIYTFSVLTDKTRGYEEVPTSVAMQQLNDKNVDKVQINDREQQIQATLKNPIEVDGKEGIEQIIASYPNRASGDIFNAVKASDATDFDTKVTHDSILGSLLVSLVPMLLIFGLLMFLLSRMQGGGGMNAFGMGKSRHKELNKDNPENTFDDVAGADEAVEELDEIRDFLSDPSRYEKLGAKIPRGVLLYGPPGTGKTLLARAVAGEAGVPFYSISGSDFVEMFVGVGASRVRDLFKQAKENSPCIIFVDEIDAVGRQRGSGMGGGHDEREQTLNQLLVEMDGFGDREGVILMAATNRPDILDPALLRPGRFDRQIPVTNPDLTGREQILRVHAKGKPLADDVDLKSLAKRTAGMSGADLENVLNEAALLTARVDGNVITGDALEEATDRVIGGPRRSTKIISETEKKITAYHEGGHTLAAWALKDIDRVYKVTILARGRTGGHAMTAPEDDKGMYNRSELFARLVFAMGGRAAEELVFGNPTTGASADIEMATNTARSMVMELGMSPKIGAVKYGIDNGDPFRSQGSGGSESKPSPEVAAVIDNEVRMLMDKAQTIAYEILRDNREYLDKLAEKLLEKETLRRPDLEAIFDGIEIREITDIFPMQDVARPKDFREPVKTPNELAKERGEEPPKRNDFFSAARKARIERRKAAQEKQLREAREKDKQHVGAHAGAQNTLPDKPGHDHLWGGRDYGTGSPNKSGTPSRGGAPGSDAPHHNVSPNGGIKQEEQRGFRLPDHEQPDHPWTTDDAPTRQIPSVPDKPAEQPENHRGTADNDHGKHAKKPQQSFPWEQPVDKPAGDESASSLKTEGGEIGQERGASRGDSGDGTYRGSLRSGQAINEGGKHTEGRGQSIDEHTNHNEGEQK
ncbi:ATP-dependent zinc metalloprotease FtsH [Corynebacterium sp. 4HC-13]|uniref:ATP-dependent zinc metalloprotease FtsH n=1 Tax=Corynebacterium anserum TaxID=2684406 RepID=UPI00163B54E7|nr:ATP-dependent zinc metalloprotease FtsH [Corynebacterium anserum]MBC2681300.1 ATP-dependent zinc metalloprotease FtsH [Corynebacterium anserum]